MSDYQWSDEHIKAVVALYAVPELRPHARAHFDEWLKRHDARILREAADRFISQPSPSFDAVMHHADRREAGEA